MTEKKYVDIKILRSNYDFEQLTLHLVTTSSLLKENLSQNERKNVKILINKKMTGELRIKDGQI